MPYDIPHVVTMLLNTQQILLFKIGLFYQDYILAEIIFGPRFAQGSHFKQKSHVQLFRLFSIEFAINWRLQNPLGKSGMVLLF